MIQDIISQSNISVSGFHLFSTKSSKSVKVELLSDDGVPCAIAKIARSRAMSHGLQHELAVLKKLQELKPDFRVPEVLSAPIINTRQVNIYKYVSGEKLQSNVESIRDFCDQFIRFQESTATRIAMGELSARFSSLCRSYADSRWFAGSFPFDFTDVETVEGTTCLGFTHMDLICSNIIESPAGCVLLDFEHSIFDGVCLVDLFSLLFHSHLRNREKLCIFQEFAERFVSHSYREVVLRVLGAWFVMRLLLREGEAMDESARAALLAHFAHGSLPISRDGEVLTAP